MRALWIYRFAKEYMEIFSKPEGAFTPNIRHAYQTAYKLYEENKQKDPKQTALDEITKWYCE
jgi:hypothetical protein